MKKLIVYIVFFLVAFTSVAQRYTTYPILNQSALQQVAYSYYKFTIDACRSSTNMLQFAELNYYNNSSELNYSGSTATYSTSFSGSEPPSAAFDNNASTKFVGYNVTTHPSLTIQLSTAQAIDSYSYTTANDATDRDPITWSLYGSNDGTNWTLLDSRSGQTITSTRNVETQIWTIP